MSEKSRGSRESCIDEGEILSDTDFQCGQRVGEEFTWDSASMVGITASNFAGARVEDDASSDVRRATEKRARGVSDESCQSDDSFITVGKRPKRSRVVAGTGLVCSEAPGDRLEVSITSRKPVPKQIALAKLLRAEDIEGILKIKFKNAYKVYIQFSDNTQAEKLIQSVKFNNDEIRSQWTDQVSCCYGIVKDVDVEVEDDELLKDFKASQDVLSVHRLNRLSAEGQWVKSETIRLRFKGITLPAFVHAYGCRFEVQPYVFPVTQCSGCWKFGHRVRACPIKKIICPKCGKEHANCETTTYRCVNCKGAHMALDKICPIFKKEKELRILMSEHSCTFKRASELFLAKKGGNKQVPQYKEENRVIENSNSERTTSYRDALLSRAHKVTETNVEKKKTIAGSCPTFVPLPSSMDTVKPRKKKDKNGKQGRTDVADLQETSHDVTGDVNTRWTESEDEGKLKKSAKREQYIFNVFEVIVSTLETKLQRIENLDKAVEHLMRRVEALDSRVNDNIHKTDAIISKLGNLDLKLFSLLTEEEGKGNAETTTKRQIINKISDAQLLDRKLESLDQKVSDIDSKLVGLKHQIDNNFLPVDDINAEASEKKPISLNVIEIAKGLNTEVITEITKEVDQLRTSMSTVDRKLQFHINLVSENLGKVLYMMADVHAAIVEPEAASINVNGLFKNRTMTSTQSPVTKGSKIDTLVNKIIPMMSVSEKMDEVWDVVVGTKSSVDDLVPKSDELLTQTQRQERAIGQIHSDLRLKTNLIIENLDMVEKRLKKQEDDVATLAQRPVPAELLLDPTIDRLVEYGPTRYRVDEPVTDPSPSPAAITTTQLAPTTSPNTSSSSGAPVPLAVPQPQPPVAPAAAAGVPRPASRKGGIIFPSVKNKPIIGNNTFASEIVANYKDVKGFSCVDLLNAGMRESGVYYLQIRGTTYWFLKVYCEQNVADGGWTVIHRRDDYGALAENFNRDWGDYKNGFGEPSKEFWLGNENIYMLTNNDEYMLRVELEDFDGNKRYAQYSHFKIYSEGEYYKLEIDGYEGNAGDSLNDPWYGSNNSPFSTYNRDNDRSSLNCASMLKGGWWWKSCGRGLNGLYLHDPQDLTARQGIVWFRWRGWDYTLKRASMMIKPKGLQPNT